MKNYHTTNKWKRQRDITCSTFSFLMLRLLVLLLILRLLLLHFEFKAAVAAAVAAAAAICIYEENDEEHFKIQPNRWSYFIQPTQLRHSGDVMEKLHLLKTHTYSTGIRLIYKNVFFPLETFIISNFSKSLSIKRQWTTHTDDPDDMILFQWTHIKWWWRIIVNFKHFLGFSSNSLKRKKNVCKADCFKPEIISFCMTFDDVRGRSRNTQPKMSSI